MWRRAWRVVEPSDEATDIAGDAFSAHRYNADHPALIGEDLSPR
ncbi:MAG: hypothetical protein O2826_03625 [Chloroflexi bacterium]|nr:hypothetical protein [Chloroflexota bacterium]MDA1173592.1 hypothetical protein [Chloroflexota bacterium]